MLSSVPDNLHFGSVRLLFDKYIEVEPGCELVPYYHFRILNNEDIDVGHINFKVGDTRHIVKYVGHIGYGIKREFRGKSYALQGCKALKPFISKFYTKVIFTTHPDNVASVKTIENLGARFLEKVYVPEDDPSFGSGARVKIRYEWNVE